VRFIKLAFEVPGVTVSDLKRMKEFEAENAKLNCIYAELALENAAIRDVLSQKL
jgi:putative transposase